MITPIEKMVALVQKISANPLGVEYKMFGEKDGFISGMETTILLTTITKIGGLMRVGFGEAGASVIAKNLNDSEGGKLNFMGSGTMINSIFGFCDVRQFTDTTECLQEEVMLFVNRIAHILHGIVVQCSGAANKNIGDAFLLTWKLDEKLSAEEVASLADQALVAFLKTLIELSRYQDFICNFTVAATARLYKRFPDYNVRIGCGLHVGWAIEGAIGSNRKIDASYLSPHVNMTEYLESSTKAYGVPLLLSEPFYRLLSPAAAKYVRQVDRVRRSMAEEPVGLYTYDADVNIDWEDVARRRKLSPKERFAAAARKMTKTTPNNNNNNNNPIGAENGDPSPPNAQIPLSPLPSVSTSAPIAHGATGRSGSVDFSNETPPIPLHGVKSTHTPVVGATPLPSVSKPAKATASTHSSQAPSRNPRVTPVNSRHVEDVENPHGSKEAGAPVIVVPTYTQEIWVEDLDIMELRHRVNDSFRVIWAKGMEAYISGDWQKARDIFHETNQMSGSDGPSKFMIEEIDSHGGTAPHDWPGYRMDGDGH